MEKLLELKKYYQQNHAQLLGITANLAKEWPLSQDTRDIIKDIKEVAATNLKLYRACCYALANTMVSPTGDVARLLYRDKNGALHVAPIPKEIEPYYRWISYD